MIKSFINRLLSRGRNISVKFKSEDRVFKAFVPDNELWGAVKDVLLLEAYEALPAFRLKNLKRGGKIIDAGAHVGLFTLKASPYAEEVIAIEPQPLNIRLLKTNIMINEVHNVRIVPKTLWNCKYKALLEEKHLEKHDSSISKERIGEGQAIGLTEVIENLNGVEFLKMDVEGVEYDLIASTPKELLKRVSRFAIETHDVVESHLLWRDLKNLGFKTVVFTPPTYHLKYTLSKLFVGSPLMGLRNLRIVVGLASLFVSALRMKPESFRLLYAWKN